MSAPAADPTLDPSVDPTGEDPNGDGPAEREPGVVLHDPVVTLRPISAADVDQITAACQDEELQRYIPVPRPYARRDAEDYVALSTRLWPTGRKAVFTIADPADDTRLLGVISLTIAGSCGNAAYWVAPGARGRGVAGHALGRLARWAFDEQGIAVLLLEIRDANHASKAVARACGFHHSGSVEVPTDHGPQSALLYVRLASDVPPNPRP